MTRLISLVLAAILFLAVNVPVKLRASVSQKIPKEAIVKIILLKAPGINDEGSRWGIAYQFRIINQADDWLAWKQGKFKGGTGERVGELIKEGGVKRSLQAPDDRTVVFHVPFSAEIQKRLENQPREWIKITPGHITAEQFRLSREQETKAQIFLFYPIISVYDAKLKKNIIISASRTWSFADYRQAKFEITLEVNEDGSYSTKSSLPTKIRSN